MGQAEGDSLKDFEQRFNNWLHWCKQRGLHQERAGSAEGNYRSPQTWEPQNPRPDWLIQMNVPDAILINRAYWQLGDKTRRTIKILWFRAHWRPQYQAQKLGCHYTELAQVGDRAKKMLENRLCNLEIKRIVAKAVTI